LEEVVSQGEAVRARYSKTQLRYHATMKSRLEPDHTGVQAEKPMQDKINIRALSKMCGLPGDHVRKMADIFDREVPKQTSQVKGQDATQQMSKPQFQRFMTKNGYKNPTIVARLFEVFDSARDQCLSFEELLAGLAFFEERPGGAESFIPGMMDGNEDDAEADDIFLGMVARFFDLDGRQLISKLNVFKVINILGLQRDLARPIADAIFDQLSMDASHELTYTEFIQKVESNPQLCFVMHKAMLLQGKEHGTPMHENAIIEFRQLTKDWYDRQMCGRLVGVDMLVAEFLTANHEGEEALLKRMFRVMDCCSEDDKERSSSATYYLTCMEGCVHRGRSSRSILQRNTVQYSSVL